MRSAVSWHWTASLLLIWKGMGGRALPVTPVCSVPVWSIWSPAWWANDFSTIMLQVWEIICKLFGRAQMGHSSLCVSLPPSLPHLSWWLQPVFNTFCPSKSVCSGTSLASATECNGFSIYHPLPAALVAIQEIPHNCHIVERPWLSWKYCKRLSSCGTSSPAVSVCWKKGLPACCLGWQKPPRHSLMESLVLVSHSREQHNV